MMGLASCWSDFVPAPTLLPPPEWPSQSLDIMTRLFQDCPSRCTYKNRYLLDPYRMCVVRVLPV